MEIKVNALADQHGAEDVNKNYIHDWIGIDDVLYCWRFLILDHGHKLSKEFLKLVAVVEVLLGLCLRGEQDLELTIEDHVDEVVHEARVEAIFGLDLECDSKQLEIEDPDVGVRVPLKDFENPLRALQIILEKLWLGTYIVGK